MNCNQTKNTDHIPGATYMFEKMKKKKKKHVQKQVFLSWIHKLMATQILKKIYSIHIQRDK